VRDSCHYPRRDIKLGVNSFACKKSNESRTNSRNNGRKNEKNSGGNEKALRRMGSLKSRGRKGINR